MQLYTALIDAQNLTQDQFRDDHDTDRPDADQADRTAVTTSLRQRMSAMLHGRASAFGPTKLVRPGTDPAYLE